MLLNLGWNPKRCRIRQRPRQTSTSKAVIRATPQTMLATKLKTAPKQEIMLSQNLEITVSWHRTQMTIRQSAVRVLVMGMQSPQMRDRLTRHRAEPLLSRPSTPRKKSGTSETSYGTLPGKGNLAASVKK